MSAEPVIYQLSNAIAIRNETDGIIHSVMQFNFDLDAAIVSLNTIQAHLATIIDDLTITAGKEKQKTYDFMLSWLNAFFRMLQKYDSSDSAYEYLFYGAALTINKFLDDQNL